MNPDQLDFSQTSSENFLNNFLPVKQLMNPFGRKPKNTALIQLRPLKPKEERALRRSSELKRITKGLFIAFGICSNFLAFFNCHGNLTRGEEWIT